MPDIDQPRDDGHVKKLVVLGSGKGITEEKSGMHS